MPLPLTISRLFVRLSTRVLMVFLVVVMLAVLIGTAIPTALTAYVSPDKQFQEVPNRLHIMDAARGLAGKVVSQIVNCCVFWSPDGTRVAFNGGDRRPYIWDQRDNTLHPVGEPGLGGTIIDWSPDGTALLETVYQPDGNAGHYALYRLDLESGLPTQLTFFDAPIIYGTDWSPDGRFLIFAAKQNGDWDIYRIESDGGQLQRFHDPVGDAIAPQVSPDSREIAFTLSGQGRVELYKMRVDGSGPQQLTWTDGIEYSPRWSPDGQQILFGTAGVTPDTSQIYAINADGSGLRQLTDDDNRAKLVRWCWLPDGSHILYETSDQTVAELYVMDIRDNTARRLLRNTLTNFLNSACQP